MNEVTCRVHGLDQKKRTTRLSYAALSVQALTAFVLAVALPNVGRAATFAVNSTADVVDLDPGDGRCDTGNVTAEGELECTLRAAVQQSNNLTGDDVINLPANTYQLALPGELEILDGLSLQGAGADSTIIERDAVITRSGEFRVQEVGGDEVLTVFRSARCEGSCDGVLVVGSEGSQTGPVANISDVTIRNGSGRGGGLSIFEGSSVFLTNSIVRDNAGIGNAGAGIFNQGFLELSRSTITNNQSFGNPQGGGQQITAGGIFNSGETVIVESTISNNQANRGGGIANRGQGTLDIKNSTISGNNANLRGGGIFNSLGTANVSFSTITNNRAAVVRIFLDQPAQSENPVGGGIANDRFGGTITMHHTILANNSQIGDVRIELQPGAPPGAPFGVGVFEEFSFNESFRFQDQPFSPDCSSPLPGTFTSSGNNLIGIADFDFVNRFGTRIVIQNCNFAAVAGDLVGPQLPIDPVEGPRPIDPQLGSLAANGGPTLTHELLPGSPAIDAGDNAVCPPTDQRGFTRPADGDGNGTPICDIGAFERSPPAVGSLQFGAATFDVAEDGGRATITVTRTGGSEGEVTVNFMTSDDTATAGADYEFTQGFVTFGDGDTGDKTFSVPIIDDTDVEGPETVKLALSNPTNGATLGDPQSAVLTIQDDERPGGVSCAGQLATIFGTQQRDRLRGTDDPDVIQGLGGNDQISGLRGNDIACGGPGNDEVVGGFGNDRLLGNAGNDRLVGAEGTDRLNGGAGQDQCNGGDPRTGDSVSNCETVINVP